jgi:superfamily I DNA/RNA helicase
MIQRIRYMIEFLSVMPQHIMCITYTRTAGCNMEMRIKRELARYRANLPMVRGDKLRGQTRTRSQALLVSPLPPRQMCARLPLAAWNS